jgi:hypothetical protein
MKELFASARAALAACPPGSMICGITGLAMAGLALPSELLPVRDQTIHVAIPLTANRRPRRQGVTVHFQAHMPAAWSPKGSDLVIAYPTYCWAHLVVQLMSAVPWHPGREDPPTVRGLFTHPGKRAFLLAVQVGDSMMRRPYTPPFGHGGPPRKPLISQTEFDRDIAGLPRMKGIPTVRLAYSQVRANTDSFAETQARLLAWDAGFPVPEVNRRVVVYGREYFLDMAWTLRDSAGRELRKIAYEYHGQRHFDDRDQRIGDFDRRGALQAGGWHLVEAAYKDLMEPTALISRLAQAHTRQ